MVVTEFTIVSLTYIHLQTLIVKYKKALLHIPTCYSLFLLYEPISSELFFASFLDFVQPYNKASTTAVIVPA